MFRERKQQQFIPYATEKREKFQTCKFFQSRQPLGNFQDTV